MRIFKPFFISMLSWTPDSWRSALSKSKIMPEYFKDTRYDHTMTTLKGYAPLIFANEAKQLQTQLGEVCVGRSFLLIGGDCAETFQDANVNKIWNDFRLFLQISLLLTFGIERPVVKIARIAGQYAKPRSNILETRNNITLPSYQGDIINSMPFTKEDRAPDPLRMLSAYHYSTQTLNILRAFIQGGYSDLQNYDSWVLFDTLNTHLHFIYNDVYRNLKKALRFFETISMKHGSNKVQLYTGHEALLLPYEECLVRNDSISQKYYDTSAHFLWIGERTRELDGPHIEFMRGIENPIGVKISEKITPEELLNMTYILNPQNIPGRLTIMTRMGTEHLKKNLPFLIHILKKHDRHVIWVCDPMHANTFNYKGKKTRDFNDIWNEIQTFFEIHWDHGSVPGGIHLEMTSKNVTECIGGNLKPIKDFDDYQSSMDPRLNYFQSIEMVLLIISMYNLNKKYG